MVMLDEQGAAKLLGYADLAQGQADSAKALGCMSSAAVLSSGNCQAIAAAAQDARKSEVLATQDPSLWNALPVACAVSKYCSAILATPYLARGDLTAAATVFLTGKLKGTGAVARVKPVNLPGWKKVSIDMDEVRSGHMVGGSRVSPAKTLFPSDMTERQVERSVREAYRHSTRVRTQGVRVLVRGTDRGRAIMMWVNRETKTIETAYLVR